MGDSQDLICGTVYTHVLDSRRYSRAQKKTQNGIREPDSFYTQLELLQQELFFPSAQWPINLHRVSLSLTCPQPSPGARYPD